MNHSFIGQYLLEKQLLTRAQLDNALQIQKQSNIRLGQLSINQEFLDIEQVLFINRQQRLLNKKFGDIAVDNGLLTPAQVELLLDLQKQHRKFLGTILIEQGLLSEATLNEVLVAQQKHQRSLSLRIGEITGIDSPGDTIKTILALYEKLFLRCLNSPFKVVKLISDTSTIEQQGYIISLTIDYGINRLRIAIAIDQSTLQEIGSRFMGITTDACDTGLAQDATGEFLNCIAGYIISDVIPDDYSSAPTAPVLVATSKQLLNDYKTPVAVEFASDAGSGVIVIANRAGKTSRYPPDI